jgi:hypothetical protein
VKRFETHKVVFVITGTDGKVDINTLLDKKWLAKLESDNDEAAHRNLKDLMDHLRSQKRSGPSKRTISLILERVFYTEGKYITSGSCKRERMIVERETIGSSLVNL